MVTEKRKAVQPTRRADLECQQCSSGNSVAFVTIYGLLALALAIASFAMGLAIGMVAQ